MGVMDERSSRVFIGVSLLVLLWIGTYWVYDPDRSQRTPPISFAAPPESVEVADGSGAGSSVGNQAGSGQAGGLARPGLPAGGGGVAPPATGADGPPGVLSRALGDQPAGPGSAASPAAPATADPTGVRVVEPRFRDHTIKPGDTFETIARQYFGSASMVSAIARANPLKDPRRLRVGEVLRVPVDPENIQGRVVREDGTTPDEPVRPPTPSVVEYRVKAGDTLTKIAQAYYGSVRHADFIFRSNRDSLASPDSLRVGQTLRLPPLPAGAGGEG